MSTDETYIPWEKIKAARAAQNDGTNFWDDPCGACLHPMREHRLNWNDPTGSLAPDCLHSSEQYNPYERVTVKVVCTCREFQHPTT